MLLSPPAPSDAGARHLRALAQRPRFTGTAGAADARAYCVAELEHLGFQVAERPFEYSRFPGRWATPVAGIAGAVIAVVAAALGGAGQPLPALATSLLFVLVLGVSASWMARAGVLSMRVARRRGVNLVATRSGGSPRVWLVAHVDSKSQLVPMAVRVVCIVLLALALAAVIALSIAAYATPGTLPAWTWWLAALSGGIGGAGVAATLVGDASPGAVDNASGVATVLAAAKLLERDAAVGVLITDAEELGLAGARALARALPVGVALNVDGVDDEGALSVMVSAPLSRSRRLQEALLRGAQDVGVPLVRRRVIPGVLVDAVAFHDAGWEAVTLSRGTIRTLTRIHTAADDLAAMTGRGIPVAARVLARAAGELA